MMLLGVAGRSNEAKNEEQQKQKMRIKNK